MEALQTIADQLHGRAIQSDSALPDLDGLKRGVVSLKAALFPEQYYKGTNGIQAFIRDELGHAAGILREQMACVLHPAKEGRLVDRLVEAFLKSLPGIQEKLREDLFAAVENDPVGPEPSEIIVSYPGFQALIFQRIAHELYTLEVPLLPRMISESAHGMTGIDIHPAARLGSRCFIDHGTGVVIGATAETGTGVTLYQGVTLGAKNFPRDAAGHAIKGRKRHPTIGDHCTIYAGATILGNISVGHHSVIGGNVWVTRDVPAHSRITQRRYHQEVFAGYGDGI